MKTSSKIKIFLIVFFIAIFAIIAARHFIGLHFKKKFSVRPAPGVIVSKVEKSLFYKSIETFGTAIAQNSKAYRVQASNINGKLKLENRFVNSNKLIVFFQSAKKSNLEKIEDIELLRALEIGLKIKTIDLVGDSFSVDVMEDFIKAKEKFKTDKILKRYS